MSKSPATRQLANDAAQGVAIAIDELAGEHDEAATLLIVERLGPLSKDPRELSRKGARRMCVIPVVNIEHDADFGGVGDDQLESRRARHVEHRVPLVARRERAAE